MRPEIRSVLHLKCQLFLLAIAEFQRAQKF